MSRKLIDGYWVISCDWVDPRTAKACTAQFLDPTGGRDKSAHFQCGSHHGIIPQSEKPEFQLPADHKLNEEVLVSGKDKIEVEDISDDR